MPDDRFTQLPSSLQRASRMLRLGDDVPALVAHPDWETPAPAVIWMHGRTVYKELDPGRYLRWVRAGIAAVALDLPGHGERLDREHHKAHKTVETIAQMVGEIDGVVASLRELGVIDLSLLAIGGMSAGGMVTLRRLCDPHPFIAASVECTTGDLAGLYFSGDKKWDVEHDPAAVARVDPSAHLGGFEPIPVLALQNELDEMIPISLQRGFLERLRARYEGVGADPGLVRLHTFPETGAPQEHAGFGRLSNEAKGLQLEFLRGVFGLGTEGES